MLGMRKWKPRQVTKPAHDHTARKQQNCNLSPIKSVSKNLDALTYSILMFYKILMFQVRKLQPAVFNACVKLY